MAFDAERALIQEAAAAIEKHEGKRATGWLAPYISQTHDSPDLLREAGFRYMMDWPLDDQPVWFRTKHGPILSIPYAHDLNDSFECVQRRTPSQLYCENLIDHFDEMLEESGAPSPGDEPRAAQLHPRPAAPAAAVPPGDRAHPQAARQDLAHAAGRDLQPYRIPAQGDGAGESMTYPLLFTPLSIAALTLKNRVVVAPMHQYSADKGFATDWHVMNAGRYAAGGAGLVFVESTKIERRGCGTVGDLGLWDDAFVPKLTRVAELIHYCGAVAGIQLGHSGRKSRVGRPWEGGRPLSKGSIAAEDWDAWELVAPSAIASEGAPVPRALTIAGFAQWSKRGASRGARMPPASTWSRSTGRTAT